MDFLETIPGRHVENSHNLIRVLSEPRRKYQHDQIVKREFDM